MQVPRGTVGTIPGVLTEQENQAIAEMFTASHRGAYTLNGTTRPSPVEPGMVLDIRA